MEEKEKKSKVMAKRKSALRALRHRNYRLFFAGQSISMIGTWMQRITIPWLVYRLTDSPFLLGFVGFAGYIPVFILLPFAGVLADRWNRRRLLILTQILSTIQAFVLSFLVLTGTVQIWQVVVLSLFLGVFTAFDIPTRQSFLMEMIEDKEDLGNAIALNSSIVTGARMVGPTIAGVLIGLLGEGICFLLNGFSYLAVIAAYLAMKIQPRYLKPLDSRVWDGLKEGFTYASGFVPIRTILGLLALVSLVGMPYVVLMPIFAKNVLHGGPNALGFLMGASGLGALMGAFYLANRSTIFGLWKIISIAASLFGLGLVAFSSSRVLWLSLVLLLVTGFGHMVLMASSNTILQTVSDDDKRGRVMSFYAMSFGGMRPFGSLFAGFLASKIGAPATVLIGGTTCLLGAILFARKIPLLNRILQPVYERMGIISEND